MVILAFRWWKVRERIKSCLPSTGRRVCNKRPHWNNQSCELLTFNRGMNLMISSKDRSHHCRGELWPSKRKEIRNCKQPSPSTGIRATFCNMDPAEKSSPLEPTDFANKRSNGTYRTISKPNQSPMMSLQTALRPSISRCVQRNSILTLSTRDMTILSKQSGEDYKKQVSRGRIKRELGVRIDVLRLIHSMFRNAT